MNSTGTSDELDRDVQAEQARESLAGHRPGDHVAPDDDAVHARLADVVQDGLKGREVPVDVVDGSNPHQRPPHSGETQDQK